MRKIIGIALALVFYIAFIVVYFFAALHYEYWLLPALIRVVDVVAAAIVLMVGVLCILFLTFRSE